MNKIIFLTLFFSFVAHSITPLKDFESRWYSIKNSSIKDLSFKMEVSSLKEKVSKLSGIKGITTLFYEVYWLAPKDIHIEIVGLPKVTKEIEKEVRDYAKEYLHYVIKESLLDKLEGYSFSKSKSKEIDEYQGIDKTYKKTVSEVWISFDKRGTLRNLTTLSPVGRHSTSYVFQKKGDKFLLTKQSTKTTQGSMIVSTKRKMVYNKIDNIDLISEINEDKEVEIVTNPSGKRSEQIKINFSNFKINKGRAKRKIVQ